MKSMILKIIPVLCAVLMMFCGCTRSFDEEWIIGKTASDVIDRYGEFDVQYNDYFENGTYNGWTGVYKIKDKHVGYLQTYPEETFEIKFDKNNVAEWCGIVVGQPGN